MQLHVAVNVTCSPIFTRSLLLFFLYRIQDVPSQSNINSITCDHCLLLPISGVKEPIYSFTHPFIHKSRDQNSFYVFSFPEHFEDKKPSFLSTEIFRESCLVCFP